MFLRVVLVVLVCVNFLFIWRLQEPVSRPSANPPVVREGNSTPIPEVPNPVPEKYDITPYPNRYLSYQEVYDLLKKWSQEAPEIARFGEYGETPQGRKFFYLRIGTPGKPKILIHATIHGNERLATGATLWMMHQMLHDYGRKEDVTELVKTRDVWFVPILSPDSYLRSRYIEGVDPNRDYPYPGRRPHTPSTPIRKIMELHEKEKFLGVISGHTTGEIYFWPSLCKGEDARIHSRLAQEMSRISGYRNSRIDYRPNGYEIDWYYWKGAIAILTEFGRGSHNQPVSAISVHGKRNYGAYMHFIKKVPELKK